MHVTKIYIFICKLHIHENITQHIILVHYIFMATNCFCSICPFFVQIIYYSCTFETKRIGFLGSTSDLLIRCLKTKKQISEFYFNI